MVIRRLPSQAGSVSRRGTKKLRDLVKSGPLTYIATINADGSPHVTAIWIGLDGGSLLSTHMRYNTKLHNMERDPRVVLSFAPPQRTGD